jgi:hypothetical protein
MFEVVELKWRTLELLKNKKLERECDLPLNQPK